MRQIFVASFVQLELAYFFALQFFILCTIFYSIDPLRHGM